MDSRGVIVIVGMLMSMGVLLIGFFALGKVEEKEENVLVQTEGKTEVVKIVDMVEPLEIEKDVELEVLPNSEAEAARWNEAGLDFIAMYNEYRLDPSRIEKDNLKSNDEVTTFFHEFNTSLKISLQYTVDNETAEITEMRLVGYEEVGVDRAAIFHAMSIFVSYVDSEIPLTQAGVYLGDIPFATDQEGTHKMEFNGRKYEFVLDFRDGLNMLVYKIGG